MSVEIRRATAADAHAILHLWREADAEPSHTDTIAGVTALVRHDAAALVVAVDTDGQRMVGSVIAAWDGWRGSIYRLAVAPDHRREGLGRRLLAAAEARLLDVGAVRSQAIVVETDTQATGFWHATEWTQQANRLRFVRG
ncbi:MAG: hypothetical protein QOI61_1926 [Actinomycetota bacterium]